jgi:hypothetical protein
MKAKLFILIFLCAMSIDVVFFNVASASAENWVEVTRFTGSGAQNYATNYFICNNAEWRIRYEYVTNPQLSVLTFFKVFIYSKGEDAIYVDSIDIFGANDTSGISYVHNKTGTFYLKINANTQSNKIFIEQDTNSVPEFPSLIFVLPLIVAVSLGLLVYCRKKIAKTIISKPKD